MNEFSPGVLKTSVRELLRQLRPFEGDRAALCARLVKFPSLAATRDEQRRKRANNVLIGMSQCGLFDLQSNKFTALATELAETPSNAVAATRFARHILRDLHGLELVRIVRALRQRQEPVSLKGIRGELRREGFTVTTNEGNASKLRQWLEAGGVFDDGWNVDEMVLGSLIGMTSGTVSEIDELTPQQRVFLNRIRSQALTRPQGEWIPLGVVKDLIDLEYGRAFLGEGTFRARVVDILVGRDWLEARGTGGGRGGKIGEARATAKLLALQFDLPFPIEAGIPRDLRGKLQMPLDYIFRDLASSSKHKKGLALELLALKMLIELDLIPVGFRLRARDAQGAEADLTADGLQLQYSRWLVQCKNTSRVAQSDLVRELGMAHLLKAHVILLVTTGSFGRSVRTLADQVARDMSLQVLLLDGDCLKDYRKRDISAVVEHLRRQAQNVLTLKVHQAGVAGDPVDG